MREAPIEQAAASPQETVVTTGSAFPDLDDYNLAFHGMLMDPPLAAPDFTLVDHNGHLFRLSDQIGNVVVLFFGYTACPDVCPSTLAQFRQVKQSLGPDAQRVRFVLVTVDPERDTPEHLKTYIERFDTTFYGLTGSIGHLQDVWDAYDVYVDKVEHPDSLMVYSVDHSSVTHVIDADGHVVGLYPFGIPPKYVAQDLKRLVQEADVR